MFLAIVAETSNQFKSFGEAAGGQNNHISFLFCGNHDQNMPLPNSCVGSPLNALLFWLCLCLSNDASVILVIRRNMSFCLSGFFSQAKGIVW